MTSKKPIGFHAMDRVKPSYRQICDGKFALMGRIDFYDIEIFFWKNNSKNYRLASFLCSIFPEHIDPKEDNEYCNYALLSSEKDFLFYFDVLKELLSVIYSWKYIELYVNYEQCFPDELSIYIHTLIGMYPARSQYYDVQSAIKDFRNPWLHEKNLYHIVCDLFPGYTVKPHYRAKWLENLELDIYIENFNLAIEYQGVQHYKPLKHWGGDEGFMKRRVNDIQKKRLCEIHGTSLIYFSYLDEITEDFVESKLIEYFNGGIQHETI